MDSKQYARKMAKILTAGLFTLLFAVSFMNNELFSKKQTPTNLASNEATISSRLPASANVNWEADLIKKYTSGFRNQKNIIIGKRPDTLDKFTFGTLNGNYAISYTGGKISTLEYGADRSSSAPQTIDDTYNFLVKNKEILAADFASVAKINERHEGKNVYEEYGLFDANLVKVATAVLTSDQDRRLLSLKIARDGHIASN